MLTIAGFTLLEALRHKLLWLVVFSICAGFALAEFLGAIAIMESTEIKSGVFGAMLRLFAVFIVALFVTTSMVREFTEKGLELVLSLPVPRAIYYFGKLLGFSAFAMITAGVIGLCLLVYVPAPPVLLWVSSLGCELLIVSAMSLLCLFTFNQVTVAFSAVAAFYVLSRSMTGIQLIGHGPLVDTSSQSQHLITALLDAIAYILPDLDRFTPSEWLIYHGATVVDLLPILGQTVIYLVLLVGAALFDLYRKNL